MCQCIVQATENVVTLPPFGPHGAAWDQFDEGPKASSPTASHRQRLVKPRMRLHAIVQRAGEPTVLELRWGWVPDWSMGTRPALTQLPLEQVMRARLYARLRDEGRALIPVEGWYETAADGAPGSRQRLAYVTSRRTGPLYLAAVAQASLEHNGCDGLALVTHASDGGVPHLMAFDAINAQAWLHPELDWDQAQTLARHGALGADRLEQLLRAKRNFTVRRQ